MNNRRKFLKLASAGVLAMILPSTPAYAASSIGRKKLILLTLEGGCDTLNMFIPNRTAAEEAQYLKLRGDEAKSFLAIEKKNTLALNDTIYSMHPKLTAIRDAWNSGNLALFPATHSGDESNTSHFHQFNLFDRGAYSDAGLNGSFDGWIARYLNDEGKSDNGLYAYNFATARKMFANANSQVFGHSNAASLNLSVESSVLTTINEMNDEKVRDGRAKEIVDTQKTIFARINRLKGLGMTNTANASYKASSSTAKSMTNAIEMLRGIDEMDVVQLSLGGFDTHTDQLRRQDALFTNLNDAIEVFTKLGEDELENTLLVVQTEFSRTLDANGTGGTDHGKAAMWFVVGGEVRKGVYGKNVDTCLTGTLTKDDLNSMDDMKISASNRYYFNEKNDYRDVLATSLDWIGAKDPASAFDLGNGVSNYSYKNKIDYMI